VHVKTNILPLCIPAPLVVIVFSVVWGQCILGRPWLVYVCHQWGDFFQIVEDMVALCDFGCRFSSCVALLLNGGWWYFETRASKGGDGGPRIRVSQLCKC
jgi:hypothetical protein